MTGKMTGRKGVSTELIHAGETDIGDAVPLTTPIYETSTFVFENAAEVAAYNQGKSSKYLYSRYAQPDDRQRRAEAGRPRAGRIGAAVLVGTGRDDDDPDGAREVGRRSRLQLGDLRRDAAPAGRSCSPEVRRPGAVRHDRGAGRRPSASSTAATRVVWFESPINPTLRCLDIEKIAAAARARGVLSVIDNTFASPINQQPLAARHRSGDAERDEIPERPQRRDGRQRRRSEPRSWIRSRSSGAMVGTVMDPYPAYALGRGLKTLPLRIARHNANAQAVAEFLAADRRVSQVYYPGLPRIPTTRSPSGR